MKFPPVGYDARRETFGTPQGVPPLPMTFPGIRRRSSAPGAGGIVEVRSDHCYADIVELPGLAVSEIASVKVLDQPSGLRNMLMLRNPSATQTIFVSFGREASANSILALLPGAQIAFDIVVPQNDVWAFSSAAGGTLTIGYSTIPEV